MISKGLSKLNMPDAPGVYTFRDRQGRPLYIGRATSLKDRVRSYFSADVIETRGPRIVDMVTRAATVTWEETGSVLEAILLESELIKRYQPPCNVDERDDKSAQYVVITDELWPRVFLARARDLDQALKDGKELMIGRRPYALKHKFGPYPESGLIKEALKILRKLFPFKDKKSADPRHDAFYQAIGRSPDDADEGAHARYLKTIEALTLFFQGKKKQLRTQIEADMHAYAKELAFEEAARMRRLLYALDHINDMALIKRESVQRARMAGDSSDSKRAAYRIEAYDVAHLGGFETVGVMVVYENGAAAPSEYRKFKISKDQNDDLAGLEEILSRRLNHPEWPFPDLIAVDGDERHIARAEGVLKARRIGIPVVAVTKDERHKAAKLTGHPDLVKAHKASIIGANAEAHRYAISFHRHRRAKSFIDRE